MSDVQSTERGDEPAKRSGGRLFRLQKRMLGWLDAEERRTDRVVSGSHHQLVQALPHAKGNISHSLRLLEARGLVEIVGLPGGLADSVRLTSEGCQRPVNLREIMIEASYSL